MNLFVVCMCHENELLECVFLCRAIARHFRKNDENEKNQMLSTLNVIRYATPKIKTLELLLL